MNSVTLPFYAKLAFVLIIIICLGYIAVIGQNILAPLFFSLLFSMLLLPMANFLENKFRLKRALASVASVLIMLLVIISILYFLGTQLGDLWKDWPLLQEQVTRSFQHLQQWIADRFHINTEKQLKYLSDRTETALSTSATVLSATVITVSSTFLFLVFIILFTFFILNYRGVLYNFLRRVFKEEHLEKVTDIVKQIQYIIKRYIMGLFLQMLIVSTLTIFALWFAGIKYAVLLGMIAGIFNVIPYLGIAVALIISLLITFATAGATKVLLVILVFVVIHAIDGNILMPLVVGSRVKINALIAFIGIVVGEMVWGISGMFLCIPYLAMLKIIFDKIEFMKPWGILLGEEERHKRKRKVYQITKKIKLEEPE